MSTYRGVGLLMAATAGLTLVSGHSGARAAAADPARYSLSFVKFNVSDLAAMQAFYEKAFGMRQKKRIDNANVIEVILSSPNGLDLSLVRYKDNRKVALGDANGPIGFYLQDVDGAYRSAMAAGAASRTAPRDAPGLRVAIVADPEGHEIELLYLH